LSHSGASLGVLQKPIAAGRSADGRGGAGQAPKLPEPMVDQKNVQSGGNLHRSCGPTAQDEFQKKKTWDDAKAAHLTRAICTLAALQHGFPATTLARSTMRIAHSAWPPVPAAQASRVAK